MKLTALEDAAQRIGATPSDMPGLWNAPGHPELTSAQVIAIASALNNPVGGL